MAVAESREEAQRFIQETIAFHVEGLRAEGLSIPAPTSLCDYVELQEGMV